MNIGLRDVVRNLGLLLCVLSALVGLVGLFAVCEHWAGRSPDRADIHALLISSLIGFAFGGAMWLVGRGGETTLLGQREALLLVAASWIVGAGLAAAPFRLWASIRNDAGIVHHSFDNYVNCYFEAMSGLTTTGATVVTTLASLPRSLLLWRALTHWLGGLGIVVLFVAVLPMLGVGSRRMYRIEAPGPTPEGVRPRIQEAARALWYIYMGLTVVEIIALRLCGMTWFDSVCHTMATLATGGFSTQDASIAAYPAISIHLVIIVFMVLAGINFGLYHQLLHGRWKTVLKDPELRTYLLIIVVATIIVSTSLMVGQQYVGPDSRGVGETVRHSVFQVVALQTTTGFCSADFDTWGFAAKATLLILMFVGASAGSTGGGIKVVRIMIVAKVVWAELEHVYRPKVVRPVKIGKSPIDAEVKTNTAVYLLGIAFLFALGTVMLMLFEAGNGIDITTAATASAATLNNIGPGLARVGATHNYAWFTDSSKIVMSVLMLLGRLEMFTIVALFSPRFWRAD